MTNFYVQHNKAYVAVDCIIFGFDEGKLKLLIGKRKMDPGFDEWSLYGGFVEQNESIDEAASRVLYNLTGMKNAFMKQVAAFGAVDRDPGERVISIAYYSLINVISTLQASRFFAKNSSRVIDFENTFMNIVSTLQMSGRWS